MRRREFISLLVGAAAFAFAGRLPAADLPVKAAMVNTLTPSGYIEMYSGWSGWSMPGEPSSDGWVVGGAGRGNWWLSQSMSGQFDLQGERTRYSNPFGSSHDLSLSQYLVGGHLSLMRDPQRSLIGIYGGIGDINGVRYGLAGLEGQAYWQNFTLYGQVAYTTLIGNYGTNIDGWLGRLTGRYYFYPSLMLEASGLYSGFTVSPSGNPSFNGDLWLWSVKLEKLFNPQLSTYLKYQGHDAHSEGLPHATDHRVMVGFRVHFNQKDLKGVDRNGVTLDIMDTFGILGSSLSIAPASSGGSGNGGSGGVSPLLPGITLTPPPPPPPPP